MRLSFLNPDLVKHFNFFILGHWLFLTLSFSYFLVVNGIVHNEELRQGMVKTSHTIVSTHSDRRKGNVFLSTPDYFLRLSEVMPDVDAFLKSSPLYISFSYQVDGKIHNVRRELPVYLVSSGYFDALDGRFVQGRGFTRNEAFAGKPLVVMGEGVLFKLFGRSDLSPSRIWINGTQFQTLGTWAFKTNEILENEAIFLPIGLSQMFGKQNSTFVTNFLLRGQDSGSMLRLKKSIDLIQISSGNTPIRPEFSLESPTISKRNEYIMGHNKAFVDSILWLSFLGFIVLSFFKTREWVSYSKDWAIWQYMLSGTQVHHAKIAYDQWLGLLSISLLGTVLTSMLIFFFMKYIVKIELAIGPVFHLSIIGYFLFIPIQYFMTVHWTKRLSFSFEKYQRN